MQILLARALPRHETQKKKKKECNTRTSQEVTHPSTTLAQARLTSEFEWDPVLQCWYDGIRYVYSTFTLYSSHFQIHYGDGLPLHPNEFTVVFTFPLCHIHGKRHYFDPFQKRRSTTSP